MAQAEAVDEVLALALKLSPRQRIQLIERIASSIDHDAELEPTSGQLKDETWGQKLVRLVDQAGGIELIHPEIEDATEWVKQIRRDQDSKRGLRWDETE